MIRPITIADAPMYFELLNANRQRLKEYFPVTLSKTETPEQTEECIANYLALQDSQELYVFLITHNEQAIGVIIIKELDHRSLKCEFAWFIDGAYEGKGYASRATQEALHFVFNELKFNKAFCIIPVGNAASIALAQRNGFIHEGTLRANFKLSDNSFTDVFHFGLLKSDWQND
jgi:RimJ/RimL family protein N-acetyltransferase